MDKVVNVERLAELLGIGRDPSNEGIKDRGTLLMIHGQLEMAQQMVIQKLRRLDSLDWNNGISKRS
jgi:hypothetical protein